MESLRGAYQLLHFDPHISDDDSDDDGDVDEDLDADDDMMVMDWWICWIDWMMDTKFQKNRFCDKTFSSVTFSD